MQITPQLWRLKSQTRLPHDRMPVVDSVALTAKIRKMQKFCSHFANEQNFANFGEFDHK